MKGSHSKLILIRHGQSYWNKRNIFTGWVDVPLSPKGIKEALSAGKSVSHIPFDMIFTSSLVRAQMTAMLMMSVHESSKTPVFMHSGEGKIQSWGKSANESFKESTIPVIPAWQLNERMYGNLQGFDKDEMREKFGEEQIKIWRRSFDVAPPEGESLEMTAKRSIPYFEKEVLPFLHSGKNVLIAAHGNSLRSIVMDLDNLSKEEVLSLEIPTGEPLCYHFASGHFKKVSLSQS